MIVGGLEPNGPRCGEGKLGRGETLSFAAFPTALSYTSRGENMGDTASAAVEEDVWNAACVSAGAEVGRRPVAQSGRGDGRSDCATDTELFIDAGAEQRRIRVSRCGWPPRRLAGVGRGGMCECPFFSPSF